MANLLLGCDQTALAIASNSCSEMTFIDENVQAVLDDFSVLWVQGYPHVTSHMIIS